MKTTKKPLSLLTVLCLTVTLLTACGEEQLLLTAADYELDMSANKTSKGITVGDDSAAFLAAYGDYEVLTCTDGASSYQVIAQEEIPFTEAISTLVPTFFIDGEPVSTGQICEINEIEKKDILSLLSSPDYLNAHTVVYHYLIFSWENGAITDIHSEYMDFNEDASYYEEIK